MLRQLRGAGEHSWGGSSGPEWSGQGEKGAPAGWLGLPDTGRSDGKCGLVAFIYLLAF